jgi:GYF domain 2
MSDIYNLPPYAPASTEKPRWYLARGGERQGPLTNSKLYAMAADDHIEMTDLVWRPGFPAWKPAGEVAGLLTPPPLPQGMKGPSAPEADRPPPLPVASGQ